MGNVNLPTPVAVAGGAFCILGGYLLGVLAGPDAPERTTATVQSYDESTSDLCLTGDAIGDQAGVSEDGVLCGKWRRTQSADTEPAPGDEFRFVSMVFDRSAEADSEESTPVTVIYGGVVR